MTLTSSPFQDSEPSYHHQIGLNVFKRTSQIADFRDCGLQRLRNLNFQIFRPGSLSVSPLSLLPWFMSNILCFLRAPTPTPITNFVWFENFKCFDDFENPVVWPIEDDHLADRRWWLRRSLDRSKVKAELTQLKLSNLHLIQFKLSNLQLIPLNLSNPDWIQLRLSNLDSIQLRLSNRDLMQLKLSNRILTSFTATITSSHLNVSERPKSKCEGPNVFKRTTGERLPLFQYH
jgi:hypothetical protein